jgi:hypothetical protein
MADDPRNEDQEQIPEDDVRGKASEEEDEELEDIDETDDESDEEADEAVDDD